MPLDISLGQVEGCVEIHVMCVEHGQRSTFGHVSYKCYMPGTMLGAVSTEEQTT